jgi:leucyl aminopeptidase
VQVRFESVDPFNIASDALILPVIQQDQGLDLPNGIQADLAASIKDLAADARFEGEAGSTLVAPTLGRMPARRIVLAGLGRAETLSAEPVRKAWGAAATASHRAGARRLVSMLPPPGEKLVRRDAIEAAASAVEMATYRYEVYHGSVRQPKQKPGVGEVVFAAVDGDRQAIEAGIARGTAIAGGVTLARDLNNQPASDLTPIRMAEIATETASNTDLGITVYEESGLQDLGANAILTVGRASSNPPRLIHLVYRPDGAGPETPSIGIVGKCITFDTGGYSIKTTDGMVDMKGDMAGGAAVLGAMTALRALDVPVVVHGVICAAENMISSNAFRPGDVITGMNGVTMEIISTDAEGRLVLADGLVYTARQGVREMVDLATLTGAKMIALGSETVALFANDDALATRILEAASSAAEPIWRLPLSGHLESQIEGEIADIKNSGGRMGGAITAALFLQHFAEGLPWAHLDIAGANRASKASAYTPKGSTGVGVRTLLNYLQQAHS